MSDKNKYRVWNEVKQKMEYDVYKEYKNIMQYTGEKDKNGKDAYELDIIPYHFNPSKLGIIKYGKYSNCFDKWDCYHIGFYVDWLDEYEKNTFRKDLGYWLKVSEIIGNIYENKNLIST